MEIGIVGLPNVGKSSLFNLLTSGHVASSNYPFTTIEPNVGMVSVPDPRLTRLAELFSPEKLTPAAIKFVDIAGLVKGASQGEGLGNKFLSHVREVDAIVHLVRLFHDENVVHTMGSVDPLRDVQVIETELILADLDSIDKQISKSQGTARSGDRTSKEKLEKLEQIKKCLDDGKNARLCGLSEAELRPFFLLSAKPILYVGNIGDGPNPEAVKKLELWAKEQGAGWLTLSIKLETELLEMSDEDRKNFRTELGLGETGLERLVRESYRLLDQVTFFTAGPTEVRSWITPRNAGAVVAASKIHTDISEGFIRADIYSFKEVDQWGSEKALQEKGLIRSEGKEYLVQDGDVCFFHFRD